MPTLPKILFLPKWYPNRTGPLNGIFIQKQVKAVSAFCEVAVLFVRSDEGLTDRIYDIQSGKEDGIFTVRVYHKKSDLEGKVLGRVRKFLRYIKGSFIGYREILQQFGKPDLNLVYILRRPGILLCI